LPKATIHLNKSQILGYKRFSGILTQIVSLEKKALLQGLSFSGIKKKTHGVDE
jgi:hypothetical protein